MAVKIELIDERYARVNGKYTVDLDEILDSSYEDGTVYRLRDLLRQLGGYTEEQSPKIIGTPHNVPEDGSDHALEYFEDD